MADATVTFNVDCGLEAVFSTPCNPPSEGGNDTNIYIIDLCDNEYSLDSYTDDIIDEIILPKLEK